MLQSPWLYQLNRKRPVHRLHEYQQSDVIIIGAGISGVVTAYHVLRNTPYRVLLLDAHRVGHGASGKNAGYMLADVERPLKELVDEMGEDVLKKGIVALDKSWDILEAMQKDLGLATPIYPGQGHYGYVQWNAFLMDLENFYWKQAAGIPFHVFKVRQDSPWIQDIPTRYDGLWEAASHAEIVALLEHEGEEFQAVGFRRMACGNSALLSEEIVQALTHRFAPRFSLFEETHVTEVRCSHTSVHVRAGALGLDGKWVVLCTNGFEQFHITDADGASLDPKFHTLVTGEVAYMRGYLQDEASPAGGFLFVDSAHPSEDPYLYVSRRPFEFETKPKTLVCIGGPEYILPEDTNYDPFHDIPPTAEKDFERFLSSKQQLVSKKDQQIFRWHGLMGYTPNRVRCIGFEPCQPTLLYNLGCNGLGLMPSMYGGWKIAQLLIKKDDGVRLFDPQDRRCLLPPRKK